MVWERSFATAVMPQLDLGGFISRRESCHGQLSSQLNHVLFALALEGCPQPPDHQRSLKSACASPRLTEEHPLLKVSPLKRCSRSLTRRRTSSFSFGFFSQQRLYNAVRCCIFIFPSTIRYFAQLKPVLMGLPTGASRRT